MRIEFKIGTWYLIIDEIEYPFETEHAALIAAELIINTGINPFVQSY